jgi:phosphoglucosamine mutase
VNVRVRERRPLDEVPAVQSVMADVEGRLGREGRLLVRYSGTEPLLRIMLEGPPGAPIDAWAHEIATVVREHVG